MNPLIGICQELAKRGHVVGFHGRRSFVPQLDRAGVHAHWFGETSTSELAPDQLAARLRQRPWLVQWYRRAMASTAPTIDAITSAIMAFRPNVVAVDPVNAAGAIAAERAGLPWVAISTNFACVRPEGWTCMFLDVGARAAVMLHELARSHGVASLRLEGTEVVSPWLNTVFTTEELAPRPPRNDYSRYVGPARVAGVRGDETAFPWERIGDRPLVYVSSGGGQSLSFDVVQVLRIARAIDLDEVALVIASPTLHAHSELRTELPEAAIVTGYAPQRALLARATVAVTHGGVNTVNECLEAGCPMLVLPLALEQPLQAELVARGGTGIALDPTAMTDEDLRGALARLRSDGGYRERARAVRDAYRATDSSAAVCDALDALAPEAR